MIRALSAMVVMAAAASTADARAADEAPPWYRRPYGAIRVIGAGSPDLFGASMSMYVPRPFVLEAGLSRGVGNRGSWYARGGPALSLREARDPEDVAWDTRHPDDRYPAFDVLLQPMGGYRWSESNLDGVRQTASGPTLGAAVDVMMWANAKSAIDFQLSIGGAYWLEKSDPNALSTVPDVHLALGFAF